VPLMNNMENCRGVVARLPVPVTGLTQYIEKLPTKATIFLAIAFKLKKFLSTSA
jgi:hypothetical protein